ncbi:MAG: hypothetical protein JNM18_06580 [Planctomycetaceae bacterium]|nr:hypothetical protein [Planctomycetaceae bacterium]
MPQPLPQQPLPQPLFAQQVFSQQPLPQPLFAQQVFSQHPPPQQLLAQHDDWQQLRWNKPFKPANRRTLRPQPVLQQLLHVLAQQVFSQQGVAQQVCSQHPPLPQQLLPSILSRRPP